MNFLPNAPCKICGANTIQVGEVKSDFSQRIFQVVHCPVCHYSFITNPNTDYQTLYSEDYYAGKGADPLVDYVFELEHPQETIRTYEWAGVFHVVQSCVKVQVDTRWLDFGCGNGGLVRYCQSKGLLQSVGFDEGGIVEQFPKYGIPLVTKNQLADLVGSFDVITAIEVLEHVENPLATLATIRSLLKPGGLFFYTTGNAKPFRDNLLSWPYLNKAPDLHISFYEPTTLERALGISGFRPEYRSFLPGFANIIRFKMLKTLGYHRRSIIEQAIPWVVASRVVDLRYQVTAHPIAWAV